MEKTDNRFVFHISVGVGLGTILATVIVPWLWDLGYNTIRPLSIFLFLPLITGIVWGLISYRRSVRRLTPKPWQITYITRFVVLLIILASPVFLFIGAFIFVVSPWPSPQPFSSSDIDRLEGAMGSFVLVSRQNYSTSEPISVIQDYYHEEMRHYCVDEPGISEWSSYKSVPSSNQWGIEDLPELVATGTCVRMLCDIVRWQRHQDFEVLMCSESESLTIVSQISRWED